MCGELPNAIWAVAGRRAGAAGALLALALGACGGGAQQATPPRAAAAPEEEPVVEQWRPSPPPIQWGERPVEEPEPAKPPEASPAVETVGGRTFDDHDRALLCGPGVLGLDASGFDEAQRQVQEGDRALAERVAAARSTSAKDCRVAVDALNGVFQQLAASSRSLCDHQYDRGVGVTGEELVARTSAVLAEIDDRVAAIAVSGDEACPGQAGRLAASVERWRAQRDRVCARTDEQQAISTCGVESSDAAQQQRARSYCDALAAKGVSDPVLSRPLELCVNAALDALR